MNCVISLSTISSLSGFLATEAGLLGRVFGDAAITAFASYPVESLVNVLFSPVAIGMTVCIALSAGFFDYMEV
jgi:hypothetical protein